jgi:hypothetical protein
VSKIHTTEALLTEVKAAAARASERPSDTTVAVALTTALNDPKNFEGRKVIAREAATYDHPSPKVQSQATSKIVDRVLLDDEAIVFQCRTCGTHWASVPSALAHSAAHSRTAEERAAHAKTAGAAGAAASLKARRAKQTVTTATTASTASTPALDALDAAYAADAVARGSAPAGPLDDIAAVDARDIKTIHPEVHEIVRNLRALATQQRRSSEALVAIAADVAHLSDLIAAKPKISDEEIAELRAQVEELRGKANQLDTLKNLLNQ